MTVTQQPLSTGSSSISQIHANRSQGRIKMGTTQEQENTNQQIPQRYTSRSRESRENLGVNDGGGFLSPGFKSVAAMAGWDEEALLLASLVVEDTPERGSKEKKRPELRFITPPTNSRRKRRAQRRSPVLIQSTILNLDDEDTPTNIASIPPTILDLDSEDVVNKKDDKKKVEAENDLNIEKKDEIAAPVESSSSSSESASTLPNIDKLRDELSCAICLEVCFEPSTTPCGHSFCKKCLRSAADKCGKRCPKCRQLISNGRSYTVNTVLWNTIQLLFPAEVEARKAAGALNTRELERQNTKNLNHSDQNTAVATSNNVRLRRLRHVHSTSSSSSGDDVSTRSSSRRAAPLQDEDSALALRLQREEFMQAYNRPSNGEYRSSVSMARDNLRAMASRAISLRTRNRSMYN
ncbi:hypothetical protein V2J09_006506 [Rumex salicifolius]